MKMLFENFLETKEVVPNPTPDLNTIEIENKLSMEKQ